MLDDFLSLAPILVGYYQEYMVCSLSTQLLLVILLCMFTFIYIFFSLFNAYSNVSYIWSKNLEDENGIVASALVITNFALKRYRRRRINLSLEPYYNKDDDCKNYTVRIIYDSDEVYLF